MHISYISRSIKGSVCMVWWVWTSVTIKNTPVLPECVCWDDLDHTCGSITVWCRRWHCCCVSRVRQCAVCRRRLHLQCQPLLHLLLLSVWICRLRLRSTPWFWCTNCSIRTISVCRNSKWLYFDDCDVQLTRVKIAATGRGAADTLLRAPPWPLVHWSSQLPGSRTWFYCQSAARRSPPLNLNHHRPLRSCLRGSLESYGVFLEEDGGDLHSFCNIGVILRSN